MLTGEASKMVDATTMLSICDPVHIVLIKTDTSGETTLVASYFLEWRTVLSTENRVTNVAVELLGVGMFKICCNCSKIILSAGGWNEMKALKRGQKKWQLGMYFHKVHLISYSFIFFFSRLCDHIVPLIHFIHYAIVFWLPCLCWSTHFALTYYSGIVNALV